MHAIAAAGAGFLIAVLWFDLMHDTLVRGHPKEADLPADVIEGIARYYRRVTTDASPMNQLVSVFMLAAFGSIVVQVASTSSGEVLPWLSLGAIVPPLITVRVRTFPNAVELGGHDGRDPARATALARAVYFDHQVFLVAVLAVLGTQLGAAPG
jgi:hypothetical protein